MNRPATSTRPRYAAWLLVVVYWLSLPSVMPVTVGLLATVASGHEVEFGLEDGHFDLVLHHDDDDHDHEHNDHKLDEHGHEHGELAKLLTGIAAHDDDGDHVLRFATSDEASGLSSTSFNLSPVPAICVPWKSIVCLPTRPACESMQRHAARPPPLASMGMLCLRTTVLVV